MSKNKNVQKAKGASAAAKEVTQQNDFINELIRQKYHITNTCVATKTPRTSYYNWLQQPGFAKRIEALREQEVDVIEDAFRGLVKDKNPQAVIFGLKTRGASRGYQEKQQIEHFGATGIKIEFEEPGKREEKKVIDVTPKSEEKEEDEE